MLRLLMLLKTRGPKAFDVFCQSLEENECGEVAQVLREAATADVQCENGEIQIHEFDSFYVRVR